MSVASNPRDSSQFSPLIHRSLLRLPSVHLETTETQPGFYGGDIAPVEPAAASVFPSQGLKSVPQSQLHGAQSSAMVGK